MLYGERWLLENMARPALAVGNPGLFNMTLLQPLKGSPIQTSAGSTVAMHSPKPTRKPSPCAQPVILT